MSVPVRAQTKAGASQAAAPGPGTPGPTVTSSLATICQGGSAVLTATPGTVSGPTVTYAWSPDVALSATSGAQVVVNPLQTTTYTVAVTADGLTTTRTVTVTVQGNCCQQSVVPATRVVELKDDTYDYQGNKPPYYGDPFRLYPPGTYFHVAADRLTLRGTEFHLPAGSVLLLEPNADVLLDDARLYLDGGTITAACGAMWGGLILPDNAHGLYATAVGTLRPRLMHSKRGLQFTRSTTSPLLLQEVDFLHNYQSLLLNYAAVAATSAEAVNNCRFDADPALMKAPYQPQGADTWVTQEHVRLLGDAGALSFSGNTVQHAMVGVSLLTGRPPVLTIRGGQFAEVYLAGVVSIDQSAYSAAQLTVAGTRFTFPVGTQLPATSQLSQALAQYSQALHPKETVGLAPLLVPTMVSEGSRFEQVETGSYATFRYADYRPRQIGIASQRLTQVLDNTFTGLAVGIAHGLRNGNTAEVRGNLFSQCEKGYNPVPFDNYTHPQPTGTAYVTCNTFERGVSAGQRGGVSYGIYQEADANVTLADPSAPINNPTILKNRFEDFGTVNNGFYALYNAGSYSLSYLTFADYSSQIQPVTNSGVLLPGLTTGVNYVPNAGLVCTPTGTPNGLPRSMGGRPNAVATQQPPRLEQCIPNPAQGVVSIPYQLPKQAQSAALIIRRALDAQLIETLAVELDKQQIDLSTSHLPVGLYFYTLVVDGLPTATRRMVVQ